MKSFLLLEKLFNRRRPALASLPLSLWWQTRAEIGCDGTKREIPQCESNADKGVVARVREEGAGRGARVESGASREEKVWSLEQR